MKMKWKVVSPYTGIEEDAPASSVGGGNIAGIGIDHPDRPGSGEPGIDPKKKKKKHTLIDRNGKIDGRTKSYREHRKKLEAARQRRIENKNKQSSKFIERVKEKSLGLRLEGPPGTGGDVLGNVQAKVANFAKQEVPLKKHRKKEMPKFPKTPMPNFPPDPRGDVDIELDMAYGQGYTTAKPMADMSNRNLQASKKKKRNKP